MVAGGSSSISKNCGIVGVPGQAQRPGQPAALRRTGDRHRVVVEAARVDDLGHGRVELLQQVLRRLATPTSFSRNRSWSTTARRAPDRSLSACSRSSGPAVRASCAAAASTRVVAGSSSREPASSSTTAAAPHQRGVQRLPGQLQADVQPVQPARPPGDVDGREHHDDAHDQDDHRWMVTGLSSTPPGAAGRHGLVDPHHVTGHRRPVVLHDRDQRLVRQLGPPLGRRRAARRPRAASDGGVAVGEQRARLPVAAAPGGTRGCRWPATGRRPPSPRPARCRSSRRRCWARRRRRPSGRRGPCRPRSPCRAPSTRSRNRWAPGRDVVGVAGPGDQQPQLRPLGGQQLERLAAARQALARLVHPAEEADRRRRRRPSRAAARPWRTGATVTPLGISTRRRRGARPASSGPPRRPRSAR